MPSVRDQIFASYDDVGILEDAPTSNFDGQAQNLLRASTSNARSRLVIAFPNPYSVGQAISAATLTFSVQSAPSGNANVVARRCQDQTFSGAATWNTSDGSTAWTSAAGAIDTSGPAPSVIVPGSFTGLAQIDVTALVQHMVDEDDDRLIIVLTLGDDDTSRDESLWVHMHEALVQSNVIVVPRLDVTKPGDSATGLNVGLVSAWPCNEESGDRADAVGDNTLSETGSAILRAAGPSDVVPFAAAFAGEATNYLAISDAAQHGLAPGNTSFSFSAWVRPGVVDTIQAVFGKYENAPNEEWLMLLRADASIELLLNDGTSTAVLRTSAGSIVVNTWYHVLGVYDARSGYVLLFVDGGSIVMMGQHDTGVDPDTAAGVGFGAEANDTLPLLGRAAQPAFWSRALTIDEAIELYGGGDGVKLGGGSAPLRGRARDMAAVPGRDWR